MWTLSMFFYEIRLAMSIGVLCYQWYHMDVLNIYLTQMTQRVMSKLAKVPVTVDKVAYYFPNTVHIYNFRIKPPPPDVDNRWEWEDIITVDLVDVKFHLLLASLFYLVSFDELYVLESISVHGLRFFVEGHKGLNDEQTIFNMNLLGGKETYTTHTYYAYAQTHTQTQYAYTYAYILYSYPYQEVPGPSPWSPRRAARRRPRLWCMARWIMMTPILIRARTPRRAMREMRIWCMGSCPHHPHPSPPIHIHIHNHKAPNPPSPPTSSPPYTTSGPSLTKSKQRPGRSTRAYRRQDSITPLRGS